MPAPRPEFEVCRACGYDISDVEDDYLICPECGAPNNRILAARPRPFSERMGARALLIALLAGVVTFIILLPVPALSGRAPWFPFVLGGAVLTLMLAVWMPTRHRRGAWEKPGMAVLAAVLMVAGIMAAAGMVAAVNTMIAAATPRAVRIPPPPLRTP